VFNYGNGDDDDDERMHVSEAGALTDLLPDVWFRNVLT
jgi:hypothetical protein